MVQLEYRDILRKTYIRYWATIDPFGFPSDPTGSSLTWELSIAVARATVHLA
jgi:hypothetical protein